jgi:hypothetical protein
VSGGGLARHGTTVPDGRVPDRRSDDAPPAIAWSRRHRVGAQRGSSSMSEHGPEGFAGENDNQQGGFVPPSTPHDAGGPGSGQGASSPFDVTPGPADVIGSSEPKPVKRAPVLLAMAAVIVLVLAGGEAIV